MIITITPYRCAKCGSGNVEPYFEGKKVAPSIKNTFKQPHITEYRCPDCGAVLNHCMDASEKSKIDAMLVLSSEDNHTLKTYIRRYKNIEVDAISQMLL